MNAKLRGVVVLLVLAGVAVLSAQGPALRPTVFAIRGARVWTEPGKLLSQATIIVRDGVIEAVGPDARVPADAEVIEGKGLTVYPGFIDGMSNWGFDTAQRRSEMGPAAPVDLASEALATTRLDNRKGLMPEFVVRQALKAEEEQANAWRRVGITAHLVAPDGGMFVGQSALVSLSEAPPRDSVLRAVVAQHASLRSAPGAGYPRALMGVIAHCRQTLLDAGHYEQVWSEFRQRGETGKRPPVDPSLAALAEPLAGKLPVVFEADSRDEIHRALDFAAEFHLKPIIYGGREAWRTQTRLKKEHVPVILRVNFLDEPQARLGRRPSSPFGEPGRDSREPVPERVRAEQKQQLDHEIGCAARLHRAGILFAISTQGQTGDKPADKFRDNLRRAIEAGLAPDAALQALTLNAARILGVDKQLGTIAPGKAAHLVVTDGDFHVAKTQVTHVFSDGVRFEVQKPRPSEPGRPSPFKKGKGKGKKSPEKDPEGKTPKQPEIEAKKPEAKKLEPEMKKSDAKPRDEVATEIESDRKPRIHTGGSVLIRGATVLTVTGGTLPKTDILIRNGKIEKVAKEIAPPSGVIVIDAAGMFVMPGIIDTHCHFAMAGGVNEFSLSVVPEVRAADVIASDDVQIYRALAGGVTTSRLLHGSANVVGGQDAVIKLKYGEPASKLLVPGAPRGVKFALGENVKRTDGRFPNTRLGVEAVLVRAFTEAQTYRKEWDAYDKAKRSVKPLPRPRRDLRLEALADVLRGDLKVHCHCYRADEILMLLGVANRFGFKVRSLQHVLEGYKIAPEIADHGASCSTFSDWWAYKLEAYDAIPFNSALLNEAGVSVCLKSDSNELMRHLYQEAAKCIKYGGMSEAAALETITINGAKQLGLEKRLGSIEAGKDGDLAIFNGHPLNNFSRVEMTIVEGEVYFQRSAKLFPVAAAASGPTKPALQVPALPRLAGRTLVISGATVHPGDAAPFPIATVVIDRGRIAALVPGRVVDKSTGKPSDGVAVIHEGKITMLPVPAGAPVIRADGLHLYAGMIDAGTVLGLTELDSARETQDFAEGGDFQPDLRASTGINPDSELIPVTRANGVTTVVTRPLGSVVAGQSALINLAGWVPREMTIVDPLALQVDFPAGRALFTGNPTMPAIGRAIARKQRDEKVRRLKELFRLALVYEAGRKENANLPVNPRLEALLPYAHGQKPVIIQANRKPEILEALQLAEELKLKMILSGGIDAWKVTIELKKREVPVILGPVMTMPADPYDPYDAPFACAAKLHAAGIRFCIRTAGASNTRNLPYEAAMAVSYGLPPAEGLKAVTLYPAQILGVAEQLGSIAISKRANLVLADGDILQGSTQMRMLVIDGRVLPPTSKHTKLYERYRERLHEVKEGKAPLGTK